MSDGRSRCLHRLHVLESGPRCSLHWTLALKARLLTSLRRQASSRCRNWAGLRTTTQMRRRKRRGSPPCPRCRHREISASPHRAALLPPQSGARRLRWPQAGPAASDAERRHRMEWWKALRSMGRMRHLYRLRIQHLASCPLWGRPLGCNPCRHHWGCNLRRLQTKAESWAAGPEDRARPAASQLPPGI